MRAPTKEKVAKSLVEPGILLKIGKVLVGWRAHIIRSGRKPEDSVTCWCGLANKRLGEERYLYGEAIVHPVRARRAEPGPRKSVYDYAI